MEKILMQIKYLISGKYVYGILALILFGSSCKHSQTARQDIDESSLKNAYYHLWLSKGAKYYPGTPERVAMCKQGKDPRELKIYNKVQSGKKVLLSQMVIHSEKALAFTLETISLQCSKEIRTSDRRNREQQMEALQIAGECIGAITALFYFNQDDLDQMILNDLKKASPKVIAEVLTSFRYEWFYNRPHPQRWIDFIRSLPDSTLEYKASTIEYFKKRLDEVEKFGILL